MFEIEEGRDGTIRLSGRLDASRAEETEPVFDRVEQTRHVDFRALSYISSAGLTILLKTQKRLSATGDELVLVGLNPHIRQVFRFAGFDRIFRIEDAGANLSGPDL